MTKTYKLNNNNKKWLIHATKINSIDNDNLNISASTNNNINFNVSGNGKVNTTFLDISNNLRIYGNSFFNKSLQIDNSSVKIPNTFSNFAVKYAYELNSVITKIAKKWIDCSNYYKLEYTPLSNKSKILIQGKISYLANSQYNQLISFRLSRIINNGQPQHFYDLSFGTSIGTLYNGIYTFYYLDSPDTSYNITYYLSYKINNDISSGLDTSYGIIGYDLSNINSFIAHELYIPSTDNIIETVNRNFVNLLDENKDASFNNVTISNNLLVNGSIRGDGSKLSGISSNVALRNDTSYNIITNLGNSGSELHYLAEHNILIGNNSGAKLFKANRNLIIGLSAGSELNEENVVYDDNILLGNNAGKKMGFNSIRCEYHVFIGKNAGSNAVKIRNFNTIIGISAASHSTYGNNELKGNVIIGMEAASMNTIGILPMHRVIIGNRAGYYNANSDTVCIGTNAGYNNVKNTSVSIGVSAGFYYGAPGSTNIGSYCGIYGGVHSLSIGAYCNYTDTKYYDKKEYIIINATGTDLSSAGTHTCVIKPIREKTGSNKLLYNDTTYELTYNKLQLLRINSSHNSTISNNVITNWNDSHKIDTVSKWDISQNRYNINTSGFWRIDFKANISNYSNADINDIYFEIIRDTSGIDISLNRRYLQIHNIDSSNSSSAFISIITELSNNDNIYPIINNNSSHDISLINAIFMANFIRSS